MEALTWIVDPLIVVASTLAIAAVVCYLAGNRTRTILVRQQMFAIRDALWDVARDVEGFRDPDYLRARKLLNDAVHAVDWLSLPVILSVYISSRGEARATSPSDVTTSNPRLKAAIERAYGELFSLCLRQAICRPSGWTLVVLWACVVGIRNYRRWLQEWLESGGLHALALLDRQAGADGRRGRRPALGA